MTLNTSNTQRESLFKDSKNAILTVSRNSIKIAVNPSTKVRKNQSRDIDCVLASRQVVFREAEYYSPPPKWNIIFPQRSIYFGELETESYFGQQFNIPLCSKNISPSVSIVFFPISLYYRACSLYRSELVRNHHAVLHKNIVDRAGIILLVTEIIIQLNTQYNSIVKWNIVALDDSLILSCYTILLCSVRNIICGKSQI